MGWGLDQARLVCPGCLTKAGHTSICPVGRWVSGDYRETSSVSAIKANLDAWREMAEMETGEHGL